MVVVERSQGRSVSSLIEDELKLEFFKVAVRRHVPRVIRVMTGRGKQRIETDSQGLIQHRRNNSGQKSAAQFVAGVGVDLDQVYFEVLVDHEIQPKNLKIVHFVTGIDRHVAGLNSICC